MFLSSLQDKDAGEGHSSLIASPSKSECWGASCCSCESSQGAPEKACRTGMRVDVGFGKCPTNAFLRYKASCYSPGENWRLWNFSKQTMGGRYRVSCYSSSKRLGEGGV